MKRDPQSMLGKAGSILRLLNSGTPSLVFLSLLAGGKDDLPFPSCEFYRSRAKE
jgi:hypothetical protein